MEAMKLDGISFNHTAGAAFTTETPVIIASAMESTWVFIPFPILPAINKTHLDVAFQEFQFKFAKRWNGYYKQRICGNKELTQSYINVTYIALKGIEYEVDDIARVLAEMKIRAETFINGSLHIHSRERRWVKPLLIGAAAAIVLAPVLKQGFCHYFSFFGFCGGRQAIDELGLEAEFLDKAVRTITLETGEWIHLLGHSLNKTQNQLKMVSHDANANFQMIRDAMNRLLEETDGALDGQRLCVSSKHHDVYQEASRFSTAMLNYSQALNALREELIAFKIGLHNFGYILDDALSSLTRGLIPASLIPPEVLQKVLDGLKLDRMREAIPRSELMTYYGFELVDSTVITTTGINVLVNIPLHHTSGLYHVYRAVALPQPIDDGVTATQYLFRKSHLLVSERRDHFAEVSEEKINSHCVGTNRLKLCLKPFSMSRTSEATCLSSLFFDLPAAALKLCPQEVVVLPEEPTADYLDDPTYLVTARSSAYKFFNFTHGLKQTGYPVPGCRSCLLRPPCDGRFENPSGTLILYPDPRTCQYSIGMMINIQQHPLLRTLFATLRKVESERVGAEIPNAFRDQAHGEMLEVLRLNLIELPEETVDEESMERISRPFAEGIINQHMPFHWSAYHSRPANVVVWFLLAIVLFFMAYLFYRSCMKNPAPLYKRLFRQQRNRFPWSRIPRDDSTDFSSRPGTGQPGFSPPLGAPPSFNSIFELNEAAISPASMSETPRRDTSTGMGMRVKRVSLPQERSFSPGEQLRGGEL